MRRRIRHLPPSAKSRRRLNRLRSAYESAGLAFFDPLFIELANGIAVETACHSTHTLVTVPRVNDWRRRAKSERRRSREALTQPFSRDLCTAQRSVTSPSFVA